MNVTRFERLRYHVTSRSGQEPYLVDVGSFRRHGVCNGRCTCQDFTGWHMACLRQLRAAELRGDTGMVQVEFGKFRNRREFFGEAGKPFKFIPSDRTRCAHIIAARAVAFDTFLDDLVTEIRKTNDDYKGDEEFD